MRLTLWILLLIFVPCARAADAPTLIAKPDAFRTLINPNCSHCVDEAKRRASELRPNDPVLCWIRGYSEGGAIPIRFFLNPYRVISDSYGVFVYDPDAGYTRGFAPSYQFRFHGWRNGIMVMRHADGTLYSCLSGLAFEGPRKGERLAAIPTLMSRWGTWLERYPHAVAYHMFDKYRPLELPTSENPDSVKSRGKPDPRLPAEELVLGVRIGNRAKAYPLRSWNGVQVDNLGAQSIVLLREDGSSTASAFIPMAHQTRNFKGPNPNKEGVSPPDAGTLLPAGARELPPRCVSVRKEQNTVVDDETHSHWDVAGRCTEGTLKGWTLEPVDAVVCKWFAWAAEYPDTAIIQTAAKPKPDPNAKVKEIAGTAEFLRLLPKPFATLKAVDPRGRTVTLLFDSEKLAKVWPVDPDAEIKVNGCWGRLEQFVPGQRVWVWLRLDRKKNPVSVIMLADQVSEEDMHASLSRKRKAMLQFTPAQIDTKRAVQEAWLRERWESDGLPGTLTFHHVFSGELEFTLDHEAMRWGRYLKPGDVVHLTADPVIKGVVKSVTPWRERTVVRLVVGELEASELRIGQRLGLKMRPPSTDILQSGYPPDIGRRTAKGERIAWFLASIYCTCGVNKDTCTGHFYTLASCNPNGCGMPHSTRDEIGVLIDQGKTDQQIWELLRKDRGPLMQKPHLMP
jgi:hypothetical protein